MSFGIVAYGAYLPTRRVELAEAAAALGGRGRGSRVVASYDEDSTTMGFEAARNLPRAQTRSLWFATSSPAYAEKTNATGLHAALGLDASAFAADVAGSPRSAVAALRAAAGTPGGLAVLSDVRVGLPGSADERDGADGAAAFLFGEDAALVPLGHGSATGEFLDRWRLPSELTSRQWEERFGQECYEPLIAQAVAEALTAAGVGGADIVIVSSAHTRTAAATSGRYGAVDALPLGNAGAADLGLRLADALDRAEPGQIVLTVCAADGADATVWRVTDRIAAARTSPPVREQLAAGRDVPYGVYLNWRGLLDREMPRRPEPERPAGPPAARSAAWKFGFVGSCCEKCAFVHLPPAGVCASCRTVGQMAPVRMADTVGTVATFTVDRLAFSPSPPMIDAVVDFDGGGRTLLEIADASPNDVVIGRRVRPVFRRLYTSGGVHNYFWKARIDGE
ncbi:MAG: OB-fold domain-containing protein [Sporichthyaceae bacterium]